MKTALLILTFTFSFSAFSRVEFDRPSVHTNDVIRTATEKCPKETKPSFTQVRTNIEIAAIAGR